MARFEKTQDPTCPEAETGGVPERGLTAMLRGVLTGWGTSHPVAPPLSLEERHAVLRRLHDEHGDFVWAQLKRWNIADASAEDLLQQVFLTLDQEIREHGPPLEPRPLLFRIAKNAVLNHRRTERRREAKVDRGASSDEVPTSRPGAEQGVYAADCARIVADVLTRMPERAAELIRLIDLDGLSHAEAAAIVHRPVDTVTKQHSRAKKTFADLLVQVHGLEVGGKR